MELVSPVAVRTSSIYPFALGRLRFGSNNVVHANADANNSDQNRDNNQPCAFDDNSQRILNMAAAVIKKFFIASMFMWIAPLAILYGFNHNLLPGDRNTRHEKGLRILGFEYMPSIDEDCSTNLSPHALTLVSGFVAVISVNMVIAFYIYMAMKEPVDRHEPDPKFLADAKASVSQPTGEAPTSSESIKKRE
ncbi:hypothetical protein Goshw_026966 [Gossypium schwendimanii]|uniref:Vacuolar ATPase assembly integral membrane protein VMA21 homolog n=1 Tax=Gossypium schwendimanii TaxID=34291 RepID=A0A7J9LIE4_GOSSC|nr:hypothetical protein [Gossypium schwendimanii]